MGTSFLKKCMQRELLSSSCRTKSGAPRTSASHLPKLGRSAFCLLSWHMGLIWSCAFGELEYLAFLFLFIWWPGAADTSSSAVLYKHSQPFFSRTTGREGCPVERGGRQGLKKPTSVLSEGWQTPSSDSCLGSDSPDTACHSCGPVWSLDPFVPPALGQRGCLPFPAAKASVWFRQDSEALWCWAPSAVGGKHASTWASLAQGVLQLCDPTPAKPMSVAVMCPPLWFVGPEVSLDLLQSNSRGSSCSCF